MVLFKKKGCGFVMVELICPPFNIAVVDFFLKATFGV